MTNNMIDTRDLHDRYNELQEKIEEKESEVLSPADILTFEELSDWEELSDMEDGIPDFWHGETLIPEDEFEEYAEELADDLGMLHDAGWPVIHIDWAAAADSLRQDYTEFEWQGTTYLAR